ncbi:MAG: twin-arginine translocation signal domain-containing protein [Chloroflexi bacterium]|nr:MAG: twin-arginine translocation signal domain-containing protein [Chloroflexota bacterium]
MQKTSRRNFLKFAGVGGAIAATAAVPAVEQLFGDRTGPIAIRAIGGVPAAPLPSYASYVLDGYIDPVRKTGTLTRTVLAGHPGAVSAIALPGLSQTVQVTDVRVASAQILVRGSIVDRSQLLPGEQSEVEITIDRKGGLVWTRSGANQIKLALQP